MELNVRGGCGKRDRMAGVLGGRVSLFQPWPEWTAVAESLRLLVEATLFEMGKAEKTMKYNRGKERLEMQLLRLQA